MAESASTERDDIRASGPNFGLEIGPAKAAEPLIKLFVPPAIAEGGGNGLLIDGQRHGYRYEGGRAYAAVPRDYATYLLGFEHWAKENPGVLGEDLT